MNDSIQFGTMFDDNCLEMKDEGDGVKVHNWHGYSRKLSYDQVRELAVWLNTRSHK
jgi:hypothetical protein